MSNWPNRHHEINKAIHEETVKSLYRWIDHPETHEVLTAYLWRGDDGDLHGAFRIDDFFLPVPSTEHHRLYDHAKKLADDPLWGCYSKDLLIVLDTVLTDAYEYDL